MSANQDRDQLRKFYRIGSPSSSAQPGAGGEDEPAFVDYARGEGLLESSGDEDSDEDAAVEDDESEEEEDFIELGGDRKKNKSKSRATRGMSDDLSDLEIDLDEDNVPMEETDSAALRRLEEQAAAYENASDDDEQREPTTDVHTTRLAVVNLDWDHVHAIDLYKIFSSVLEQGNEGKGGVSSRGQVVSVRVYPSEFGKKRMEREEQEGPPREVFVKERDAGSDDSEDDEVADMDGDMSGSEGGAEGEDDDESDASSVVEEDAGENVDMDRLRKYQLERLRSVFDSLGVGALVRIGWS